MTFFFKKFFQQISLVKEQNRYKLLLDLYKTRANMKHKAKISRKKNDFSHLFSIISIPKIIILVSKK